MKVVWWLAGVVLAGCSSLSAGAAETPAAEAFEGGRGNEAGSADEPAPLAPPVGMGRKVMVPRRAQWLADAVTAEYGGVPAAVALREVTRGRPLRLDVRDGGVLVQSPPGAVTVQEHVSAICWQSGWSWRAEEGVLLVRDIETRTFSLTAQPGNVEATLKLRALSGGKGAGGEDGGEDGGDQVAVELAPYTEEVAELVRVVLGIAGEEDEREEAAGDETEADPRTAVVALPSANAVVVTARPHLMREVEREIGIYNHATARSVRLHVALYEIERRGGGERGIDLSALRAAAVGFGLRVSAGSPTAGAGAVATLDFMEGNRAEGSGVILRWLETAGDVHVSLDDVVEVRNNAVASVNTTETRQFVAQVSQQFQSAAGAGLGTAVSGGPQVLFDELRLGWSMALQPTIVGGRVTVRLALSRRALIDERPYSFGDGAVQGLNFITDDFNRLMSVTLEDGETKILTSLVNKSVRGSRQRVPWLWWFGRGETRAEREHEVVLVMKSEVLGDGG